MGNTFKKMASFDFTLDATSFSSSPIAITFSRSGDKATHLLAYGFNNFLKSYSLSFIDVSFPIP